MYVHTHWINKCVVNIFFVFHKCPRWMSINVPPNDVLRKGTHSRNADTFIYSHSFPSSLYGEKYSKSGYPLINAVEKCQPTKMARLRHISFSFERRYNDVVSWFDHPLLFLWIRGFIQLVARYRLIYRMTRMYIERLVQLKEASDDICEKISRDVPAIVEITFLSI